LRETSELQNAGIIIYRNRLSDLLWLMVRRAESKNDLIKEQRA
jgi:cob(I)alamin adenosyltransferase